MFNLQGPFFCNLIVFLDVLKIFLKFQFTNINILLDYSNNLCIRLIIHTSNDRLLAGLI